MAQADSAKAQAKMETDAAKLEKDQAKLDADEAKIRAELEEARARLDKAARKVAELSMQLGNDRGRRRISPWVNDGGPRRAVLGVQIDPVSGKEGARVMQREPGRRGRRGGPRQGRCHRGARRQVHRRAAPNPNRAVVDHMRGVKPDQKVKVRVLREGKNKDFVVVARPMMFGPADIQCRGYPPGGAMGAVMAGPMPMIQQFHTFLPGEFGGMELASITPKLGAYFGANEGVLVVQAPRERGLQARGRRRDPGHRRAQARRRRARDAHPAVLQVGREAEPDCAAAAQAADAAVDMPDRPEFDDDHSRSWCRRFPPMPPMPAMPPVPPLPGGAGTSSA